MEDAVVCLDSYALCEIREGNQAYTPFLQQEFVVTEWTLVEFCYVLMRDVTEEEAFLWWNKLLPYIQHVAPSILLEGTSFRSRNRKHDVSFFDSIGYMFAIRNKMPFVTGDRFFKGKEGVKYIR